MNYEDTLFVSTRKINISRNGGIITRELFPSDGDCECCTRYVVVGHRGVQSGWVGLLHRAISNECYTSSLSKLPPFKDDGYYRFQDDAEQVLEAIICWFAWLRGPATKLPKKLSKPILSAWDHLLIDYQLYNPDEWQQEKASMIGFKGERRRELSHLMRDVIEERDFHPERIR